MIVSYILPFLDAIPFRPKFDFCDENYFGADGFLAILIIPQGVALCYYLSPFQG
jgi:hypothetical protein